ncbi:MAG: tRNA (N6-isopentenyl adenosine(37)-C2)-methylthiotransferase MiaB [Elusimicrobia bacterium RIFCSPHIGHO2_01_FULL_64_10]|nr:MAG: tRNA (N6-isopentenyl adenosine(37)-C2)-methylthiotransferase MiaB [Elusimicrobia bacterium RIFCSPHIGHO2_01_FULL_64_10]
MKVFIHTYGCQMNVADSQEMGRHFSGMGFEHARARAEADVMVLNTCTVRQHAEDKALSAIGRLKGWKRDREGRVLVVAGCAAERLETTLKRRFPHVDLVIGAKDMDRFGEIVGGYLRSRAGDFDWFEESGSGFMDSARGEGGTFRLGGSDDTSFVTIMRGCNYSCSYCIVPAVRGRESYRTPGSILAEVREGAARGLGRVMLLGQTVNSYPDFSDLLDEVRRVPGVAEILFMSPHPHYLNDKMIRTLASSPIFSDEIHLPVQSGSDRILRAMKRNYTRGEYLSKIERLRSAKPGLVLGTDFIVGFPGETEEDFLRTLSLWDEAGFDRAYCFKYSHRPGTEAAGSADSVTDEVKEERLSRLLARIESRRTGPASRTEAKP